VTPGGGNFGTRGSFNDRIALVVAAAKRLGPPVKWTAMENADATDSLVRFCLLAFIVLSHRTGPVQR